MTITKQELEKLETAWRNANMAADKIKQTREAEQNERERAAVAVVRMEMDAKYGLLQKEAWELRSAATKAVEEARVAYAMTGVTSPFPIGTKLFEWQRPRTYSFHNRSGRKLEPTGKVGIIEVITPTSEHPDNVSSWRAAEAGDLVIRTLRKDGTPGKSYEKSVSYAAQNSWFPAGVDPNTIKETA